MAEITTERLREMIRGGDGLGWNVVADALRELLALREAAAAGMESAEAVVEAASATHEHGSRPFRFLCTNYVWNVEAAPLQAEKTVPMVVAAEGWKEYDACGHGSQSLKRLCERGGFGGAELAILLFGRIERIQRAIAAAIRARDAQHAARELAMKERLATWTEVERVLNAACAETARQGGNQLGREAYHHGAAEAGAALREYLWSDEARAAALVDAVCRESTSVEDACNQARSTRQRADAAQAQVAELTKKLADARAACQTMRIEREDWRAAAGHHLQTIKILSDRSTAAEAQAKALAAERDALREVASWSQAVLTALNVGDVASESLLHLKLREVMINYRAHSARAALKATEGQPAHTQENT